MTKRWRRGNLDFFHSLGAISVSHQHSAAGRVGAPALPATDMPCIAHHELEVIVFVDGRREVGIIFAEFFHSDFAILLSAIKGVEKLSVG